MPGLVWNLKAGWAHVAIWNLALVGGEQVDTQLPHASLEFNTSLIRSEAREILADKNQSLLSFHCNPFNFFY